MATQTLPDKAKTGTPTPAGPPPKSPLAIQAKGIVDIVMSRVGEFVRGGQLHLPPTYSAENAMKSAWLVLQGVEDKNGKKALEVCTKDSIANSLLDMVVQGLNPGKKQGYFIVYGNTLTFQRSYFGSMAVAQMVNPAIGEFSYAVVYEGDTFKYGIQKGKKTVHSHEQELESVDKKKIRAAYCIVLNRDGNPMRTEIMTIDEIHQAWKQSKMNPFDDKGNVKESSTHGKFTADMALKTVINKCCKIIINSSSDNTLLLERINRNGEMADVVSVRAEVEQHANAGQVLEITAGAEVPADDTGSSSDIPAADPVCVCSQMIDEKLKEFDCPVHGRYKDGKFSPIPNDEAKRNPGY